MKAGMRIKDTSANATKLNDRKVLLKVKCVKMLLRLFNITRNGYSTMLVHRFVKHVRNPCELL
jgi:hypothetical protein